jgi:hypothetical protein
MDQPDILLDGDDYQKRLKFNELNKVRLEAICGWKQKDMKGFKKGAYIKEI